MATWPGTLPSALPHPVEVATVDNRVITRMDSGRRKYRSRFTTQPRDVDHPGLLLTDTQRAALETFFVTTLNRGVDSFTWTSPDTAASVSMRFLTRPTYQAVNPHATASSRLWRASFRLEILP